MDLRLSRFPKTEKLATRASRPWPKRGASVAASKHAGVRVRGTHSGPTEPPVFERSEFGRRPWRRVLEMVAQRASDHRATLEPGPARGRQPPLTCDYCFQKKAPRPLFFDVDRDRRKTQIKLVPLAGSAIQIHWWITKPESIMPTSVEQLATQAIALSPQDRAQLADLLLASLPDDADAEVDSAWDQEIMRRVAAVESGNAQLVSAADVHAEARKIYQG